MFIGVKTSVLEDLLRLDLIVKNNNTYTPSDQALGKSLELFAPVLKSYDVRLRAVDVSGCPVKFCSGILRLNSEFTANHPDRVSSFPAGGQGITLQCASIGCVGEMSERLSLCSLGADDPRVGGRDVAYEVVDLGQITGFSQRQIAGLSAKNSDIAGVRKSQSIDWQALANRWIFVRNLHNSDCSQMPAFAALFNEPSKQVGGNYGLVSTSGAAVWSDYEGARERALLELVERDAVAQAWYNRLGINAVPESIISDILTGNLKEFLENRLRSWSLTTVQTDLPVHVVVSLSYLDDGRMAAFGASARLDLASAVESAVFEMLQAEYSLDLMAQAYGNDGAANEAGLPSILRYGRSGSLLEDWPIGPDEDGQGVSAQVFSYEQLIGALKEKNISVWEFDATRPDLNIPCIKLFSPELCSWQPRFGKARLFDGVVELGLRSEPAGEEEFAARPFPF